jgi:predicted ATPase
VKRKYNIEEAQEVMHSPNEWRVESVDIAKTDLAKALENYEEQGFEIVNVLQAGSSPDRVLVLLRRPRGR